MKKTFALLSLAFASASNLYAADRLFPTDILSKGEVDIHLSLERGTHSRNLSFNGIPGSSSTDNVTESAEVRYGLGSNWHVGAALHYRSRARTETNFGNPPGHFVDKDQEGIQNPALWATYGFINNKTSPLSLTGSLFVKPNTTGKEASIYTGRVIAGWKTSETLRFYGSFHTSVSPDARTPNSNRLGIGAFKVLTESLTIIPEASYLHGHRTETFSAWNELAIGMSAIIRLAPNSYVTPSLHHYRGGESASNDGVFHQDAVTNGLALKVGYYKLF